MNIESDSEYFTADYYRVSHYPGIAFYALGWETEPDDDTEWTGIENRTGNVVMVMVGDDRKHTFDPDDIEPLPADQFCRDCGQIGCGCNVYE